jgi:hypothetical protein
MGLDPDMIDARMSREERAKVLGLLGAAEREYLDRTTKLNEEQWAYKISPAEWSVAEIAEHIVLSLSRHASATMSQ